jgi:hypothetical protein
LDKAYLLINESIGFPIHNIVDKRRKPVAVKNTHLRLKGMKGNRNTLPKEGSNVGKMRKVIPGCKRAKAHLDKNHVKQ